MKTIMEYIVGPPPKHPPEGKAPGEQHTVLWVLFWIVYTLGFFFLGSCTGCIATTGREGDPQNSGTPTRYINSEYPDSVWKITDLETLGPNTVKIRARRLDGTITRSEEVTCKYADLPPRK